MLTEEGKEAQLKVIELEQELMHSMAKMDHLVGTAGERSTLLGHNAVLKTHMKELADEKDVCDSMNVQLGSRNSQLELEKEKLAADVSDMDRELLDANSRVREMEATLTLSLTHQMANKQSQEQLDIFKNELEGLKRQAEESKMAIPNIFR